MSLIIRRHWLLSFWIKFDESSSDAESLFNGSESEPEDSYDENLFEPEQIQGLQPYLFEPEFASQSSCDDAHSHDIFEEDVESVAVEGMEADNRK